MGTTKQLEVCDCVSHIRRAPKLMGRPTYSQNSVGHDPKLILMAALTNQEKRYFQPRENHQQKNSTTLEHIKTPWNEKFTHFSYGFFRAKSSHSPKTHRNPTSDFVASFFSRGHGAPSRAAAKPGWNKNAAEQTLVSGWEQGSNWGPSFKKVVPQ